MSTAPGEPAIAFTASCRSFRLAAPFVISRGAKTTADVFEVTAERGGVLGRGEAVPYPRYGETLEGSRQAFAAFVRDHTIRSPSDLLGLLPAGAVRNALDCAVVDLLAKERGQRAWQLLGVAAPGPVATFYTLSLADPGGMAEEARRARPLSRLKLKLGGTREDGERMRAVRDSRPDARLVGDANEAWAAGDLEHLLDTAAACGFELIEQPLPANADTPLAAFGGHYGAVTLCADESVHTSGDLDRLSGLYGAVNIKLDKAGGLTEALETARAARARGFRIMVGSMVASSLGIAPALLLAFLADWVDLDSPLLLAEDRPHALQLQDDGVLSPADPALWG